MKDKAYAHLVLKIFVLENVSSHFPWKLVPEDDKLFLTQCPLNESPRPYQTERQGTHSIDYIFTVAPAPWDSFENHLCGKYFI